MFSKLCNSMGKRREWLEAAQLGYGFLIKHCFDKDGRMFFQETQDGRPLRKRRYIHSEVFAAIACAEYSKATGDASALEKAFGIAMDVYEGKLETEPKVIPGIRVTNALAVSMILLATIQSLRETYQNPSQDKIADRLVKTILRNFFKSEEKALFETVGLEGERLDSPQGRCINPGHSIETAWFLIHEGLYRKDNSIIGNALDIIDWSLEKGWDNEYGGIFSFVDIENKPPEQLEWDMKLWWSHI